MELSYPEKSNFYRFQLDDEDMNVYSFQTTNGALYNVVFKSSPYVFGTDAVFAPYLYELIIALIGEDLPPKGMDKLIPLTIHSIFKDFYKRYNDNNVCLYICESSDGKQLAKARKFDNWFNLLENAGFIKLGDEIVDSEGIRYPVSLILKIKNQYREQIIDAFANLITTYSKNE